MKYIIKQELNQAAEVLNKFISDEANIQSIENAANIMIAAIKRGNKIIACGNGGSMCDAMHFASELTGRYRKDRPPIAAIAISDPAHLSCVGNDYGYSNVFARHIKALGKPDDVLLAITTSGNSTNILYAIDMAVEIGMNIVLLSGNSGGPSAYKLDIGRGDMDTDAAILVQHNGFAGTAQEVHIKIIHILVHLIEQGI